MNVERRHRRRIGVLNSGRMDVRITVQKSSVQVGADSDIGVGTLLVEELKPILVGVQ
jgi:hypothetical protein